MKDFANIIGHEDIIEYFRNAASSKKISHAYILDGEERSGKMLLAEAFAAAIQCERQESDPCGQCHCCRQAAGRNQPDIIYVTHRKPNTLGVDDIREQINDDIVLKPYYGRHKIYIVDEAEKMNENAQNALLKTLEEPPAYAVILLLTTNAESFLPTILSRCVRLILKPVADEKIRAFLMQKKGAPDYQADLCAAFAQGNVGKAISLAASDDFSAMRDDILGMIKRLDGMDLYDLTREVKKLSVHRLQIEDCFDLMMVWYRDVLLYKATADANKLIFRDEVYNIKKAASESSYSGIESILSALEKAKIRLRANVNFELLMELLLLTIKEN